MGASICKPECMNSETTTITIKSSCFEKAQKIIVADDDIEILEHIEELLNKIHRKKTIIKEKRNSELYTDTVENNNDNNNVIINEI